jgi:endonuclease/exonuclease/phosphatase family metal-dependent hydrolase
MCHSISSFSVKFYYGKIITFSSSGRQPRALLKAMINVDGTEVAVIATHFDDSAHDVTTYRQQCVAALKTMVEGIDPSTPIIFGGDLNQAYSAKGDNTVIIKEVGEFLTSVTKSRNDAKTTMAGSTWYQVDYIFMNELENFKCGYATVHTPTSTKEGLEGSSYVATFVL